MINETISSAQMSNDENLTVDKLIVIAKKIKEKYKHQPYQNAEAIVCSHRAREWIIEKAKPAIEPKWVDTCHHIAPALLFGVRLFGTHAMTVEDGGRVFESIETAYSFIKAIEAHAEMGIEWRDKEGLIIETIKRRKAMKIHEKKQIFNNFRR